MREKDRSRIDSLREEESKIESRIAFHGARRLECQRIVDLFLDEHTHIDLVSHCLKEISLSEAISILLEKDLIGIDEKITVLEKKEYASLSR